MGCGGARSPGRVARSQRYGTWINTDYPGNIFGFQQVTINSVDLDYYHKVADKIPFFGGSQYAIVEKWTDSGGSIWYKIEWEDPGTAQLKYYELAKISELGATLEFVDQQATQGWPTEIDQNHANYRIYYRQQ